MTDNRTQYPARVDASVDPAAGRGLWLVKWLLLIPHFIVLVFLWVAFAVVSVVAFFAILFTARYPRALFDFNVGVLRWTWRVNYYGYGALGTDRYPPFTLADVADYPAHFDVAYPQRLSRGLVLVKWWLLAIPHYLIVAVFVGGGVWLGSWGTDRDGVWDSNWGAGGLVALLVVIAGIVLLFTGRYPRPLYDFILGMNRWALRVAAYASLMTDDYPPFRLDMGGPDPGSVLVSPATPPTSLRAAAAGNAFAATPVSPARPATSWTAGRIATLIAGCLLAFGAAGALVGGASLAWASQTLRDGDYLMTPQTDVSTDRYAITSESFRLEGEGLDWAIDEVIGVVRLEVAATDADVELFVGVARSADAAAYLRGVGYAELDELGPRIRDGAPDRLSQTDHPGGAPAQPPTEADIWVDSSSGSGPQALSWRPSEGDWTVVVMRADGDAGVSADVRAGATVPGLPWVIAGLFIASAMLLALGALLIGLAVHRAQTARPDEFPARDGPLNPTGT